MIQTQFTFTPLTPSRRIPTARRSDPETCERQEQLHWSEHRKLALQALVNAAYGLTDFELEARTGVKQTSIGKRRLDLVRMGYVEATDERRPSPTGSTAIVWRVTASGINAYHNL